MSFRIAVTRGRQAERFDDAFYRFMELNCNSVREFDERCGMMQTVPLGEAEHKVVTLWSDEAVQAFIDFWRARDPAGSDAALSPGDAAGSRDPDLPLANAQLRD